MLSCPMCGAENSERYRSPEKVEDVIVRRKRCLACRHVFSTAEIVITNNLAERVLDKIVAAVVPENG